MQPQQPDKENKAKEVLSEMGAKEVRNRKLLGIILQLRWYELGLRKTIGSNSQFTVSHHILTGLTAYLLFLPVLD